jgi:alanine racemase
MFKKICQWLPHVPASLSGSGGLFQGNEYLFDMVRPGRILYGSAFTAREDFSKSVCPVVRLQARILQIQDVPVGQSVGYDQTYVAQKPVRLATLSLGYADGYMRAFGNRGYAFLEGIRIPVVGRVSMDLMTVDVSAVPPALVRPGAWVDVINEKITVDDLAQLAGTVSWEILTRLGNRSFRYYVQE